jgi:hypothetical protein
MLLPVLSRSEENASGVIWREIRVKIRQPRIQANL